MRIITEFTSNPLQTCTLVLENKQTVTFRLYYHENQLSWYFDFEYDNLISNGHKVVLGVNILRSFKNIIPFGLSFQSNDGVEPFELEAFTSGRVTVHLLNQEEVGLIEVNVYGN